MKTQYALIVGLVAVLGMCSSAFADPMLTVNTVSGEITVWGSAGAANDVWSGSVSDPGGEGDTAITGIQIVDSGGLGATSDLTALYTPDVITGTFPQVQGQVFSGADYYAEVLNPSSLDSSVTLGSGSSTLLDVTSGSSSGVAAEYSTAGGGSTSAMAVAYVPEPSTLLLICLGLVGLAAGRRTR